ncbi:MAG: C40 family peptidase [Bacteroidales bacterium]|nr:C40 family peptidase [Bacteroidales bacterium]MDD2830547.1 C40 family peptidase [Bacteroidales bacterium]MDD3697459.1 C40 family peptidase [Bacteroidales bacterium]MDD4167876.1 C40 family peptidase [Bacteroidales bacterium]MDD4472645.1 C40 family peptidase [Bacteroidales bacterium]
MKKYAYYFLAAFVAWAVLTGCGRDRTLEKLSVISDNMKTAFAPDKREKVYEISFEKQKNSKTYTAKGSTTEPGVGPALTAAAASQGIQLTDSITVLPDPSLNGFIYGVTSLSVANLRYESRYAAESATQTLMGMPLRILDKKGGWTRVMTPEGYIAWVSSGSLQEMDQAAYDNWMAAPRVIVNKHYTLFREQPLPGAPVVSDGVWGNIVELEGQTSLYYRVKLPDGKQAYLSRFDAEPFQRWAHDADPLPEHIISTAMQFVGFPYLWAGTSVKAMDCSGLVKTVFYLNGIILLRDASQQARMGEPVDITQGWDHLKMGDLIFFGRRATNDNKESITHVGIYIGDGRFIHSAGRVRINSLDPASTIYYEGSDRLLKAARILGHIDDGTQVISIREHPWYGISAQ